MSSECGEPTKRMGVGVAERWYTRALGMNAAVMSLFLCLLEDVQVVAW